MSRNVKLKSFAFNSRFSSILLLTCNCWYVLCVSVCRKSCSSSWILLAFLLISTHFLKALSVCSVLTAQSHLTPHSSLQYLTGATKESAVQCSVRRVCTQIADCEQFLAITIFVSSYSRRCPTVTTVTTTHLREF